MTFELRGWHVLAGMLGFFGVVIAVNVAFTMAALESFPGEDVGRSYVQGLHYNATLAERQAQAALGWRASARLEPSAEGARVVVRLRDAQGTALEGAALVGTLQRPTDARLDRDLAFSALGGGVYAAPVGALHQGRWRLRAHAARAGDALDLEAQLTWP